MHRAVAGGLDVVSAAVVHEDDWTVCLKDSDPRDLSISNVSSSTLSPRYDQETVVVRTSDRDRYAALLRSLRTNPVISSAETLYSSELRRVNYFLMSVTARSDASIFSMMDKFRCIPTSVRYSEGMEYWQFMCKKSYTREVAANIRAMTTVKRLELSEVSPSILESLVMGEVLLSPQEFNSTLTAYRVGYFDYPRRADLTALACELNLSKGTVHEYLRKGVLKIVRKEFGLRVENDADGSPGEGEEEEDREDRRHRPY